jgi:hypothetical protein
MNELNQTGDGGGTRPPTIPAKKPGPKPKKR